MGSAIGCTRRLSTLDGDEGSPGARFAHQPIIDVVTDAIVAHDALLRMVDPQDGTTISPAEMFPAASRGGWHQALDQAARRSPGMQPS